MNRLYSLLYFLTLVSACQSFSQTKACDEIYAQKMAINDHELVFKQIAQLTACGMDTSDLRIFNTPTFIGTFIVNWTGQKGNSIPTIGDFYNSCMITMKTKEYADLKNTVIAQRLTKADMHLAGKESLQTDTNNALEQYKAGCSGYCDTSHIIATKYGLIAFTSYKDGIKYAQKNNKTVLIYFTGQYCMSCGK